MNKKQFQYQIDAVNYGLDFLLENKEFNLQSPTGSGKTFIIASLIDKYLENNFLNNKPTTFIFLAPSVGKLDFQGYEKITNYIDKQWVQGFNTNYIGTANTKSSNKSYLQNIDYFKPNNVYFFGWQMFYEGTRITEIDSEHNNIHRVIDNTKKRNINIVLIIDEAHIRDIRVDQKSKTAKSLVISKLDANKIIRVSATLEQSDIKPDYVIRYDDVREECAIKRMVEISGVDANIKGIEKYNENEQLILSAINKQHEIKNIYFKKNINIKPLILIQIPNDIKGLQIDNEAILLTQIEELLNKRNYKKDFNYAIWLNDNKTKILKNELVEDQSPIEILIFKQAIATGWDIPRANMLVRLRDTQVKGFNIQTLGRILRNPLFKYYDNDLIDNAYVFTRDDKYKEFIKEESIVVDNDEKVKVKRSSKAIKSKMAINKVKINIDLDETKMINEIVDKIIKDENFKNFFKYDEKFQDAKFKIDAKDALEHNQDVVQKQYATQMQLSTVDTKLTLIDLWIKYKTITKDNYLISNVLDQIALNVNKINIKIKDFYKACCSNWNFSKFLNNLNQNVTLKEKIQNLIQEYQKPYIKKYTEPYPLPEEYIVSTSDFSIKKWDELNTFNLSLCTNHLDSNFDSNIEDGFYSQWRNRFDNNDSIHVFRNGTGKQDYYIDYVDDQTKVRKFYPDFIAVNEITKKLLVLEVKGRNEKNIDKNSDSKFRAFQEYMSENLITDINSKYKCLDLFKITQMKDDKNDFEYFPSCNKTKSYTFKKIKQIIEEENN